MLTVAPKSKSDFAAAIKEVRRAAGLSQTALAQRLRVPTATVGRWESQANAPRRESVNKIVESFRHDLKVYPVAIRLLSEAPAIGVGQATPDARGEYVTKTDEARYVARRLDKIEDEDTRERAMTAALRAIEEAQNPPELDAENGQTAPSKPGKTGK